MSQPMASPCSSPTIRTSSSPRRWVPECGPWNTRTLPTASSASESPGAPTATSSKPSPSTSPTLRTRMVSSAFVDSDQVLNASERPMIEPHSTRADQVSPSQSLTTPSLQSSDAPGYREGSASSQSSSTGKPSESSSMVGWPVSLPVSSLELVPGSPEEVSVGTPDVDVPGVPTTAFEADDDPLQLVPRRKTKPRWLRQSGRQVTCGHPDCQRRRQQGRRRSGEDTRRAPR